MLKVLLMMPPMTIEDNYANLKTVATNMPSLAACRRDSFPPNPICGKIAAI